MIIIIMMMTTAHGNLAKFAVRGRCSKNAKIAKKFPGVAISGCHNFAILQ